MLLEFSQAVMLKLVEPVCVGVPLINPPLVSVTPGTSGKELDPKDAVVVLHEWAVWPLTVSCRLTGVPVVPLIV